MSRLRAVPDELPTLDTAAAEQVLRRLELAVRTKLDGLLQGNYQGLIPGPGTEIGDSRGYVPGDDVRRMDWPVTARTTVPHVRQTIVDRELETWVVADLSPSLDFGTATAEKRELALAALSAISYLTVRGGNRIGALVSTGESTLRIPARPGQAHARALMHTIATMPRATGAVRADLADQLESLRRPPRRRGLVAVVSDFMQGDPTAAGSLPWERALRALSHRHQLLAVEVLDPRELELPATGLVTFSDPETGRQLEVQTNAPAVRAAYAAATAEQRARIAAGLRHAGAAHLQLRTDRDWLTDVVRFVVAQRHVLAGTVGQAVR